MATPPRRFDLGATVVKKDGTDGGLIFSYAYYQKKDCWKIKFYRRDGSESNLQFEHFFDLVAYPRLLAVLYNLSKILLRVGAAFETKP